MALYGSPGRPACAQLDVQCFSSIYFGQTATVFEHTWTDFGVTFMKRKDDGLLRYWGLTKELCGLDKLVLAKALRKRSPMLEGKDREVFSINVTWPQGQRPIYGLPP
jgi:hypothetical protein